ncbi:hypothetical protein FCV25MIE_01545 [Fagus crenata]
MTPPVNGIRMLCHFRKRSSVQPPRVTTGPLINRNVSVSDFVFGQLHVAFIGHCLWDSKSAATARLCPQVSVGCQLFSVTEAGPSLLGIKFEWFQEVMLGLWIVADGAPLD